MLPNIPGDPKKIVVKLCPSTGWPDRLVYCYTFFMFLTVASIVTWKVQFGKPINCMMTADNPSPWVDYYNDLCWINGTYKLGMINGTYHDVTTLTRSEIVANARPINYYQWAHYILYLQAVIWTLPHYFWRFSRNLPAFHLMSILKIIYKKKDDKKDEKKDDKKGDKDEKPKDEDLTYAQLAKFLQKNLDYAYKVQSRPWLIIIYLITKCVYVGITFAQLSILTYFIGGGDYFWGIKKFMMATSDGLFKWNQLDDFPYTSSCDSYILKNVNAHVITLQCVLPMNMFYDKAFIFLWFYMVALLVIQVFTALNAMLVYSIPSWTLMKLGGILQLKKGEPKYRQLHKFLAKLHLEGFFLLRIVQEDKGDYRALCLAEQFWEISDI